LSSLLHLDQKLARPTFGAEPDLGSPCYQPWALTASMLADASLPRGFDADLSIAGTLSERFRQVVAFPL
jgi:hypothetical protein